jgi:hypothetical protein
LCVYETGFQATCAKVDTEKITHAALYAVRRAVAKHNSVDKKIGRPHSGRPVIGFKAIG